MMIRITIGRNPQNMIVVDGRYDTVSGNHATIYVENGQLRFEDHSTNGSYVNGRPIHNTSCYIQQGDAVLLSHKYSLDWNVLSDYLPRDHATHRFPQNVGQDPISHNAEGNRQDQPINKPKPPMPDKHMGLAIVSLILGFSIIPCLILSILAIVKAGQVESCWLNGQYAQAKEASKKAQNLSWWSIIIACGLVIIYVVVSMNM